MSCGGISSQKELNEGCWGINKVYDAAPDLSMIRDEFSHNAMVMDVVFKYHVLDGFDIYVSKA